MNVIVSVNSKYMRYLYVMLLSLYENNRGETIDVYVMNRDLTEDDKRALSSLAERYGQRMVFLFVDERKFAALPTTEKFSLETYFRLLMAELLPAHVNKVLYLDVDIIVLGRLRAFYDTDISGFIAAACQDMDNPVLEPKKRELFRRERDMRYFNAGVMLWNLERLRESYTFKDFMRAAGELHYRLQYADQEILNYLFFDRILYCSPEKYNYLVRGDVRESDLKYTEPVVLHYAGCNPWQNGQKNDLYRVWWRYAKETPYYVELLEENLWREIGFGAEKAEIELRDMESREIYQRAFLLKGSGRLRKEINHDNGEIVVYGCGTMGETLYELLSSEDVWRFVSRVADREKTGTFHGVPVSAETDSQPGALWIVTPVYRSAELCAALRDKLGPGVRVISLRDWLKRIP